MDKDIRLDRLEKKFELLFRHAPVGMVMAVRETGKILEANPAFIKSIGYTKEELLELTALDITPEEYYPVIKSEILEVDENGEFGPHYKEYRRKDGSRYPAKVSGFKMINIDGIEVVWGIIEDISERVAFEKQLARSSRHRFFDRPG